MPVKKVPRSSNRTALRDYEEHCRSMAQNIAGDLQRGKSSYWITQAERKEELARSLLAEAASLRERHISILNNIPKLEKERKSWLYFSGICKMILLLPSSQTKYILQMEPKNACKYFVLLMNGKEEEARSLLERDITQSPTQEVAE